MQSPGASLDVVGVDPDDPTCRQTTVSVSAHAARSGSQCPLWIDGRPRGSGFSQNEIALNPRAALARTSSAARSGSSSQGIWQGMKRAGYDPTHDSRYQSLNARVTAR